MKKIKILSLVMAMLMLAAALVACTPSGDPNAGGGEKEKVTLTVWGAQEDQEMLKQMCEAFAAANPDKEYKFLFGVQGEGDAADKVLNDVTSGPDVFSFASDQINKLIAGGALARLGGEYETFVKENNSATSVDAATATVGGEDRLYAYPCTEDNTLFLYYDKSVIGDDQVDTLDELLDAAHAAGRKVHFKLNDDGWYLSSFFFAYDDLKYNVTYDESLKETAVDINYNTANGLKVMKALVEYVNHPALVIQTDDSKLIAGLTPTAEGKVEVAAGVSGVWNAKAIKDILGDNMGVCKLPTANIGGTQVQLSGYMGYKLIGVNGYSQNKGEAHKLAQWLTNEQNQLKRFETRGFGPTNTTVAATDAVKNDVIMSAVLAQSQFNRAQKSVPGNYWTPMGSLITPLVTAEDCTLITDEELQGYLDSLVSQIAKKAE